MCSQAGTVTRSYDDMARTMSDATPQGGVSYSEARLSVPPSQDELAIWKKLRRGKLITMRNKLEALARR